MSISKEQKREIKYYLSLDENSLYSLLAPKVRGSSKAKGNAYEGQRRFNKLKPRLYKKICIDWRYCSKVDDPKLGDDVNLVATLAAFLASYLAFELSPVILVTILVKQGLRKFCKCY